MSGQPLVSALSICGPATAKKFEYEIDELFRDNADYSRPYMKEKILPQHRNTGSAADRFLSSKENIILEKPPQQKTAQIDSTHQPSQKSSDQFSTSIQASTQKISKKPAPITAPKPPFVVGKAPVRNNYSAPSVKEKNFAGHTDNRTEIADLKRQIEELSRLLRQHVDIKATKRDVGTDPIIFEKTTADASTNTNSGIFMDCKKTAAPYPIPTPSPVLEDSPEDDNASMCSQLESLAMQYLSDDQLVNIAYGQKRTDQSSKKNQDSKNKEQHLESLALEYFNDDHLAGHRRGNIRPGVPAIRNPAPQYQRRDIERSPPKRRMAAVATAVESQTFSPNFDGAGNGMTMTRRQCVLTTTEQQVSVFGNGQSGNRIESLPFGMSVASQDFMHRYGVLNSGKPATRQTRDYDKVDARSPNPYHRSGGGDYYGNYDAPVVAPPKYKGDYSRRRHDGAYFHDPRWN